MRIRTVLVLLAVGIISPAVHLRSTNKNMAKASVRIMSYNIRYDNPGDGARAWDYRKQEVATLIRFYAPDLMGLQEVLHGQLLYLEDQLADYGRIGVGRDDGQQAGEYAPIFYRKEQFELLDHGTFWLSETPEQPSVGWDASMERIATWGQFRRKSKNDTIYFLNTHFDHRGEQARQESAQLIREWVTKQAANYPVAITGDFNANPQSVPYQIMTKNNQLRDAYAASRLPSVGPDRSFSGFTVADTLPGERIDYVFVSSKIQVNRHAIVSSFRDGYYPSDHLPVIADVSWQP
jgi:endonuclease/exonuclease/phosphatase family metal-dependent hydrolase